MTYPSAHACSSLTGLGFLAMAILIGIGLYTSQVQRSDMARLAQASNS